MLTRALLMLERFVLLIIIAMTVAAIGLELYAVYRRENVELADLLLLFIYTEVIAMAGAFFKSHTIPVMYPLFIAITALARLIILQGKEMDPANILYEAISILVLTIAILLLKARQIDFAGIFQSGRKDESVAKHLNDEKQDH
jgi:protein PsiE